MRQTPRTRKSPGEKIVKDIRRAATARQLIRSINERGASSIPLKRRSVSYWTACAAKTASQSCAARCPAGYCGAIAERDASETLEIIRLVEGSHLSARQTLAKLGIPRTAFYRPSR